MNTACSHSSGSGNTPAIDRENDHNHDNCTHTHSHSHSHDNKEQEQGKSGIPVRQILTKEDLDKFLESDTYHSFINFILRLNEAVKNKPNNHPSLATSTSENILKIVNILDTLESWVQEFPPKTDVKSRFGNPAFQEWFDKVEASLQELHAPLVQDRDDVTPETVLEVGTYLLHSFGNRKRIDYGTGHEANFIAWLYCLDKLGFFVPEQDDAALILMAFLHYMKLMRSLQKTYWLEPAGSHGVWGLDDYHFLPFLFGSAQLHDHPFIRPKDIHDQDTLLDFHNNYMYLSCIHWINTVKSAPGLEQNPHSLRWHSPMLDDISIVKLWSKVNSGMIKMFKAEVMGKLPIMQHFLFGKIIHFETGSVFPDEGDEQFHSHAMGQEFPTCCGMRLPSAIAANAGVGMLMAKGEARMRDPRRGNIAEQGSLARGRPIPFD